MPKNSTSALAEPVTEGQSLLPAKRARAERAARRVEAALLVVAAIFFALHFVHLRADFPNHSAWMDWAKFTDEGWYGDAAIRHYQLGHWYLSGDFNPAVALPVWPLLEMALFRVTGVGLAAARSLTVAIFGLTLVLCYRLIRRWPDGWSGRGQDAAEGLWYRPLGPAIAVLLLAVSPFCFAFTRLAILEPLLILLTLGALLAASEAGAAAGENAALDRRGVRWTVALGLLPTLMVLTKTTGVFLFPSILWMLWASCGYRVKIFLRAALVACAVGAATWGAYYGLFVRPHYLLDYRYLFSANAYTGATLATLGPILNDTLSDGAWIGATLFVLALIAAAGAIAGLGVRRSRANPLPGTLLLWVFGYAAFLAYHDNLQPRYYLVLAVPLTMLVAIMFDTVLTRAVGTYSRSNLLRMREFGAWALRVAAVGGGAALVFVAIRGARQTIHFVRHPEYTFVSAANQVRDAVEQGAGTGHLRLVLSISGADISLMTGLPTICDDFGTMTLPDRLAAYQPGWFATWNDVEDDKMEALAPMYRLVRVGAFPAFDDPERNLLILYRLDPLSSPGRQGKSGRRRSLSVPRRLRTAVGEQPTPKQLTH